MGEKTSPYLKMSRRSLAEALADLERVRPGRAIPFAAGGLAPPFTRDEGENGETEENAKPPPEGEIAEGGLDAEALDRFLFGTGGLTDVPQAAADDTDGQEPPVGEDAGAAATERPPTGFSREYYLRSAARAGHDAAPSDGGARRDAVTRINPFAGPGTVDPTLQFIQSAIHARPALTEEIVTAALRISPDQAHKIVLAAIRANPRARNSILRIARNAGASGLRIAMSLIVALFLYELFGPPNIAEANEDEDAYARKLSIPEAYIAWFTSAAVTMAILFDDETLATLRAILEIQKEDGRLSFQQVIDQLADQQAIDAALANEIYGAEGEPAGPEADAAGRGAGGDGKGPESRFDAGDLGDGLEALGGIEDTVTNDEEPRAGGGRFATPDLDPSSLGALNARGGLGDETFEPGDVPEDPDEEFDPPDDQAILPGAGGGSSIGAEDGAGEEAAGFVTFMVTRDGDATDPATIDFSTVDGSARAGTDFAATSGTLAFAPGVTAMAVTVELFSDGTFEGDEQFSLVLANPENGTIAADGGSAQATIVDSDGEAIRWILAGDNMVAEGQSATYSIGFEGAALGPGRTAAVEIGIELPGGAGGASAADFADTLFGAVQHAIEALGPGSGIELRGNILTFTAGAPERLDFELPVLTDTLAELPEGYTLRIANPSVGSLAQGSGRKVTLIDDTSLQRLTWSLTGDFLVREGGAPAYTVAYSGASLAAGMAVAIDLAINLPGGIGGAQRADFVNAFREDLARAVAALGPDSGITLQGSTLVFSESAPASFNFDLPTFDDAAFEDIENFTVLLQNPSDGTIQPGRHLVTTAIVDDDRPETIAGTDTGETIAGTQLSDEIEAFGGDDFIRAGAGADVIDGGAGNDILLGEAGNDLIIGDLGDDTLIGGSGDDILVGGPGLDDLDGGEGDDVLRGGGGSDHLVGGFGADRFVVSIVDIADGADRAEDYSLSDGDEIHVLDLLGGLRDTMVDIDEFIRFQERGGDTVVQADRDGAGGPQTFVDALVIANVTGLDLELLLQQGNIEVS